MTTQIKVNEKVLSSLEQKLVSAPDGRRLSLWQLMVAMQEALQQARENGKTVEQMHADLTAAGVKANKGTFKKYCSELLSARSPHELLLKPANADTTKSAGSAALKPAPSFRPTQGGLRNLRSPSKPSGFTPK